MGDRANIIVKTRDEQVCLYTHWGGHELHSILRAALARGKDRWDDPSYLARIIFSEMIKEQILETTGFGISQSIGDGEGQTITIDVDRQTVQTINRPPTSFEAFLEETYGW